MLEKKKEKTDTQKIHAHSRANIDQESVFYSSTNHQNFTGQ